MSLMCSQRDAPLSTPLEQELALWLQRMQLPRQPSAAEHAAAGSAQNGSNTTLFLSSP